MSTLTAARPIRRLALALAGVLILVPALAGCDLNSVLGKSPARGNKSHAKHARARSRRHR